MNGDKEKLLSVPAAPSAPPNADDTGADARSASKAVHPHERWIARAIMAALGDPPVRLALWNGWAVGRASGDALATATVRDRGALYKLALNPELQFGELLTQDRIRIEGDLARFLEAVNRAKAQAGFQHLPQKVLGWLYRPRSNALGKSRENIYQHYDIGNDFYELWLDQEMVYTCAYFPEPEVSLEQAQLAKMDHVCRKACLKPGDTVVEAGCGWGALARHMARHYGVKVKAYNISHEQIVYARERARREGLEDRVEYVEGDYREIKGQFDAFVSVGMLEHVGLDNFPQLASVMQRSLKSGGRGLIHSIGRDKPALMNRWIERRIFPGAYPPSLSEMMQLFEPSGFSVLDMENLRLHYVKTLEHWLERYEGAVKRVEAMFGPEFVRTWRLYLAGSIAAFASGELQLFQVTFARHGNNQIPWTRQYLYEQASDAASPTERSVSS